ncbi:MAG: 23S rRNA (adenine(2503)-C(2))-methyltransferase RlmN [Spirochaetaceae bacterium]|nr:MAG: 23S rRNA (adenine(2503)-C(2))-methyltransferase RlmN [Spirochaetaceae bacterium]
MIPISALLPEELAQTLQVSPPYRGRQLFAWIHHRLVFDFNLMSDLPENLRRDLAGRALPVALKQDMKLEDAEGAVKFRFRLLDGSTIESVILQDRRGRKTACLSTQVGCAMGCLFCRTGSLGFGRDLKDHEIVDQYLLLRSLASPDLSSVVFMGMGEPLANLDSLHRAVDVLGYGGFSPRRITLSTCGLVEGIRSLGERKLPVRLAVSLVSADADIRNRLMPIARSNPLPELRRALLEYQEVLGKRITLEIVLMGGINDRSEDVEALVGFVQGRSGQLPLRVLINLIPWNPLPEFSYKRPETRSVEWFQERIKQAGIPVTTRMPRGSAVCGACGQLG